MGSQEIIIVALLVLAVVYVGYRVRKTYGGKKGGDGCDKCGIEGKPPGKKK